MSFRRQDPRQPSTGAAKFVALAVSVLAILGAIAYLFLRTAPEPSIGGEPPAAPSPVEPREEPEEASEASTPSADLPAFGAIGVIANVDDATVYLDGENIGNAPLARDEIPAGRHKVRVESEGYEPYETDIRVRAGERTAIEARLELPGSSLRVDSDVPGASVFLDRKYVGTTPVEIKSVSPGEHQLTVSADGYDMHAETVTVGEERRDVRVNFKKVELRQSIPVVHKHGMGSCQGTLIADGSGLRYETSHKNDAFQAPFASLEQFEIDYMDKNLKVKIRKGRNYNFTDKSGNADALFVFHREVQAFRAR